MTRNRLTAMLVAVLALSVLPLVASVAHAAPAPGVAALPSPSASLIPLPPPGRPVVSNLTATGATLTWEQSAGPVFRYSMKRLIDGVWQGYASMPINTITLTGLTPNEGYTFAVQSHALVGSGYTSSPLSEPVTFVASSTGQPPAVGTLSCRLTFRTYPGGYTAEGTMTNNGSAPVLGWRLSFTKPTAMSINYGWNVAFTLTGNSVSLRGNEYIPIQPGASSSFGFGGGYTGTFSPPTDFNPPCTVTVIASAA